MLEKGFLSVNGPGVEATSVISPTQEAKATVSSRPAWTIPYLKKKRHGLGDASLGKVLAAQV